MSFTEKGFFFLFLLCYGELRQALSSELHPQPPPLPFFFETGFCEVTELLRLCSNLQSACLSLPVSIAGIIGACHNAQQAFHFDEIQYIGIFFLCRVWVLLKKSLPNPRPESQKFFQCTHIGISCFKPNS